MEEGPTTQPLEAPDVLIQLLMDEVDKSDVENIIENQKHMLHRFEKTNEMLINCNALSNLRYDMACQEFRKHTQTLVEMKKDLDMIFRRIRSIKLKLSKQYPEAFLACGSTNNTVEGDIKIEP